MEHESCGMESTDRGRCSGLLDAPLAQVPGGGTRATGSWQAWPIPVILGQYNLGQYQISDLGTISATQTYTVSGFPYYPLPAV